MLEQLKRDMLEMIELSEQLGKYEQMHLQYWNIEDKNNYDAEKLEKLALKVKILQLRLSKLKEKWF